MAHISQARIFAMEHIKSCKDKYIKMKRIIAGFLSFILLMSNSITVSATQGVDTVSGNAVSIEQEVVENVTDTEELPDENPVVESVSENTVKMESVSENTVEIEGPDFSETEDLTFPELTDEATEEMTELHAEYAEVVEAAKADLQVQLREKDIFAIVYLVDNYEVKESASEDSDTVTKVSMAQTVQVLGMDVVWEYDAEWEELIPTVWYETQFYKGEDLYKGYIEECYLAYSDELLLQWKDSYNMLFPGSLSTYASGQVSYADVDKFPTSYQVYLRKLKDKYPKWTFIPMNVGRNWDACVSEQIGNYSWIESSGQPAEYLGGKINSTWNYASRTAIEYYMDPRNFLTESYIFQFEQNTYNASYHTQEALQKFLSNTFMSGVVEDRSETRTYAKVIFDSGKSRNLSPFNLAARVIQEQGVKGTSKMISGTYSGYEGYYNHYNISASGSTNDAVYRSGLSYAKKMGWNTRVKSLEGGAAFIGNGYILQGQDTLYLQKFDIEHGSSSLHQYMQNIRAPYFEGISMRKMYQEAGSMDATFVFKIPVYNNMPGANYSMTPKTVTLDKGNTYKLTVKCNDITLADPATIVRFSSDNEKVATVSADGTITAVGSINNVPSTAVITATITGEGGDLVLKTTVTVNCPLKGISLDTEDVLLYTEESLRSYRENGKKVAVLEKKEDGSGEYTKYYDVAECSDSTDIHIVYNPGDTTDNKAATWTISNPDVVSYEALDEGATSVRLKALKSGSAVITAKVGNYTATTTVTVRIPMHEAKIIMDEATASEGISLYKGETMRFLTSYAPKNTSDRIEEEWYTDNNDIVKIEDGNIIAVGKGTTRVHAAIGQFDGSQEELTVTVNVEAYSVKFMDVSNGQVLCLADGVYGKNLEALETDTVIPWSYEQEDYYFVGWYTQENGKGNPVTKSTVLYGDMVLYPYFIEKASEGAAFYVKPVGDYTYTGSYIKPNVTVYANDTLLSKGVHYTVSYKNNKAVSDEPAIITITGKGTFAGYSQDITFNILPKKITDIDVTAENLETDYNGKIQKMQPTVSDTSRTLVKNKDYSLSYPDTANGAYIEAGTYPVVITGTGNYAGSRTVYVTISKRIAISKAKADSIKAVLYNNGKPFESLEKVEECKPDVTLRYDNKVLTPGVDYLVSYENNKEIGIADVNISGIGDYIGTTTLHFAITGSDISTVIVSGIADKEYTGTDIYQDIVVKNKAGQALTEDLDYQITYKNNLEVGRAYVTISGMNGFTGSITKTFNIAEYDICKDSQKLIEVALSGDSYEYEKSGVKPAASLTYNGVLLTEGIDYKLEYRNNSDIGEATDTNAPTLIIIGKGSFTGRIEKTFTITNKDIANVIIVAEDVYYRNRQGFCFIEPVLSDTSGRRLKVGTDYEADFVYTYKTDTVLQDGTIRLAGERVLETDIPTPGELKDAAILITVTGMGSYVGAISAEYKILEYQSWMDNIFEDEKEEILELKVNRTVVYLDPLYPDEVDTIKLGLEKGKLLKESTKIEWVDKDIGEYVSATLNEENDRLTFALKGSRDELKEALERGELEQSTYRCALVPVVTVEGESDPISLEKREFYVWLYCDNPTTSFSQSGNIDLIYRDKTAVVANISFVSAKDSLSIPTNAEDLSNTYRLSGEEADNFEISYANSSFIDSSNAQISICAKENSTYGAGVDTGTEQLEPGKTVNLVLNYTTAKGIEMQEKVSIDLIQSQYNVSPRTRIGYIKLKDTTATGEILFDSSEDVVYETATTDDPNISAKVLGRKLIFTVEDSSQYKPGDEKNIQAQLFAKGAGKNTLPAGLRVKLLFGTETELERLLAVQETTEENLDANKKILTSYEETKRTNMYDRKIIRENTVDFSDVSIAFLGDSITAGNGLEKVGVEANVYTTVVKNSLNVKEVYRLGYGGAQIGLGEVSLHDYYMNIPSDVNIIFVQGGINDVYAGSIKNCGSLSNLSQSGTFCADAYALMRNLQTRYPNAQIIFLSPLSTITTEWYKESLPNMLSTSWYVDALKALAKRDELPNVEVWDLYNSNFLDSFDESVRGEYVKDGVHPGVAGHRVLGEYIASELIRQRGQYVVTESKEPTGNYVTPAMYKENGAVDDTDSFNRAIYAARDNNIPVYVPAGTYRINADVGIKLRDNVTLIMSPNAIIKANATDETNYHILRIKEVENVTVSGGQIIGDRYHHTGTDGEWGMGIRIHDSKNVKISDVTISNCWGDGIYVGSEDDDEPEHGCDNVTIENSNFFNNRRNNVSIVCGKNITVNNCTFDGANGTAPEYGLDIEPNHPDVNRCENIKIANSTFIGNVGASMGIITSSDSITISGCTMEETFINYAGSNVKIEETLINGNMYARMGILQGSGMVINDGTAKEDILVATLRPEKGPFTYSNYQINSKNPMSVKIIEDAGVSSGKALQIKRTAKGTQESGYYIDLSGFDLENGTKPVLESGVTYRFEYVVKGSGYWGIRTDQTAWYPCVLADSYYTGYTTYKADPAKSCRLLLYAIDTDKDVHMEVASVKIYKVQ